MEGTALILGGIDEILWRPPQYGWDQITKIGWCPPKVEGTNFLCSPHILKYGGEPDLGFYALGGK